MEGLIKVETDTLEPKQLGNSDGLLTAGKLAVETSPSGAAGANSKVVEGEADDGGDDDFGDADIIFEKYRSSERSHRLLTKEEEGVLGTMIQDGLAAEAMLVDLDDSQVDERSLLQGVIDKGQRATKEMTECNLKLVEWMAKHYHSARLRHLSVRDLVQEGNLGLMRAVDKFDPSKGFKFSTYATWWIKQAIFRAIDEKEINIRVPKGASGTARRIEGVRLRFEAEHGRQPTDEEIIATSYETVSEKDLEKERMVIRARTRSLDDPVGDEGDSVLGDFIADDRFAGMEDGVVDAEAWSATVDYLMRRTGSLSPREKFVVSMRFGAVIDHLMGTSIKEKTGILNYDELMGNLRESDTGGMTLDQVGEVFGVTRERIRQIEERALRKLRDAGSARVEVDDLY